MKRSFFTAALALSALAGTSIADVLFNNGGTGLVPGFQTGVGNGFGGANTSSIQAGFTGFGSTSGSNNNSVAAQGFGIADDFTVPCGVTWTVNSISVFAYRTGLDIFSHDINQAFLELWNTAPAAGPAGRVYGDRTTLQTFVASFSGIYRVTTTTLTNSQRPVLQFDIALSAPQNFTTGAYWMTYSLNANNAGLANPFSPPVTPSPGSANAKQANNNYHAATPTWNAAADGSSATAFLDFPFFVNGTQTGTPCPVPPSTDGTLALTDDAWVETGAIAIAAGQTKYIKFTLGSTIDVSTNTALDIDTVGSDLAVNTNIALFKGESFAGVGEAGNRVASDNDSGPGTHSQMSFGKKMRKFTVESTLGAGNNYDGVSGTNVPAGTYYVAVTCGGAGTTYGTTGYTSTTSGGTAGNFKVRIRKVTSQPTVTVPLSTDPIVDAGTLTDISTGGTPTTISTSLNQYDVKWIKFTIPAAFPSIIATAGNLTYDMEGSTLAPANSASMALFKADGTRAGTGSSSGRFGGTDFLSKQSWGKFSAVPGKPENATSMGWYSSGFTPGAGSSLEPGDYYLAVIPSQTAGVYGADPFNVTPRNAPNIAAANNLKINFYLHSDPPAAPTPTVAETLSLTSGVRASTGDIVMKRGGVVWVKFTIPQDIFPPDAGNNSYLDIDLEGSNTKYTNGGVDRATLYLFKGDGGYPGTINNIDDFNSSGVYGALTYGWHCVSYAKAQSRMNGHDSQFGLISAGDYYVAVVSFDGTNGGGTTNGNFNANSRAQVNTALPSTVKVNVTFHADDGSFQRVVQPPVIDEDLGTVHINGSPYVRNASPTWDINARDGRWVKFTVSENLTNAGDKFLDIDSNGYAAQLGFMCLYDNSGNVIATARGNDPAFPAITQCQLNFGSTSATGRFTVTGGGNNFAGSLELPAGDYYLLFTRWNNGAAVSMTNPFVGAGWDWTSTHNFVNQPSVINIRTNLPEPAPTEQRCQPADIACDDGTPLPADTNVHPNGGVNEGDYNSFFQGFFDAAPNCDIANDDATPRAPFGANGVNGGVNEGDYNCFFQKFFDGCPA